MPRRVYVCLLMFKFVNCFIYQSISIEESLDRSRVNTSAYQFELENPFKLIPGTGVGGPVQRDSYPHPYEFELSNLTFTPDQVAPVKDPTLPSMSKIPCIWVDSEKALAELQAKLEISTEFAIDLEVC